MALVHDSFAEASSERTISGAAVCVPLVVPNSLSTSHHFVSIKPTSHNFLFWHTQLVLFLQGQNLLGFVDDSLPYPPSTIPASGGAASGSVANPIYGVWIQQDQVILSVIISSFFRRGYAQSGRSWHV